MKKIAFVTPWYGKDIPGGAEMETRGIIHHLASAGIEIEVLTTCVKEFASDWYVDYYKEGEYLEDGITVRRFCVRKGNKILFDRINAKLLSGMRITVKEEKEFLFNIVNSDSLYEFMKQKEDEYALFVFIPYMFGTTYNGMNLFPNKSVMIPCLHNESYAYFGEFRKCFSKIKGIIYHAEPEKELANRLYYLKNVEQMVLGEGVNTDITGDAERFRIKYKIEKPFLLYAGRKDKTKNIHTLLEYFCQYKKEDSHDLQLVLIGPGKLPLPKEYEKDIHDLGFVSVQDKYDAYASATALCQPSKNESFSLVVMESWLLGRPVMVHEECKVTSDFVIKSNGGFYFKDYYDFAEEVKYLLDNKRTADIMGQQGREYVLKNFSWNIITKRYISFLKKSAGEEMEEE